MVMVIAIIYIFFSYVLFHHQLKITFRKSSAILKNTTPLFLLTLSLSARLPFLLTPIPLQKEVGEDPVSVKIGFFRKKIKWNLYNYEDFLWSKSAQSFSS